MPTHSKRTQAESPIDIVKELALEGTSTLAEAHRTLLDLIQQEKDIVLKGVKTRVSAFVPAAAMTDLVRRGLDTVISVQQDLLANSSRHVLGLFDSEQEDRVAGLLEFARESVATFAAAEQKLLQVAAEESTKVVRGKRDEDPCEEQHDLSQLANQAGDAFIDAQQRLIEVMTQQVNVTLQAANKAAEFVSPSQLMPVANLASDGMKRIFEAQTAVLGSISKKRKSKPEARRSKPKGRGRRSRITVPA